MTKPNKPYDTTPRLDPCKGYWFNMILLGGKGASYPRFARFFYWLIVMRRFSWAFMLNFIALGCLEVTEKFECGVVGWWWCLNPVTVIGLNWVGSWVGLSQFSSGFYYSLQTAKFPSSVYAVKLQWTAHSANCLSVFRDGGKFWMCQNYPKPVSKSCFAKNEFCLMIIQKKQNSIATDV